MRTDYPQYHERHKGIRRRLHAVIMDLNDEARLERIYSDKDDSGAQALAEERASMYRDAAKIANHVIGAIEEIERHVKANRPTES